MVGLRRDPFLIQRSLQARGTSNHRIVYDCTICKVVICRTETKDCPGKSSGGSHKLSNKRYMSEAEAVELKKTHSAENTSAQQ